mmetsp:Transcript_73833/g.233203  ORF Transcript_73833/g.233203 Transcript_73833/m.233203 type:complete len:213 (-) Transcript_73833:241-879(-)
MPHDEAAELRDVPVGSGGVKLHLQVVPNAELHLQVARGAHGLHPALGQHGLAVREDVGLLEVVRGEQAGAAPALHAEQQRPQLPARARVHAAGRLVQEHQRGLPEERRCDPEATLLPAAERPALGPPLLRQAQRLEHHGHVVVLVLRAAQLREEAEVLVHRDRLVHGVVLGAERHVLPAADDVVGAAHAHHLHLPVRDRKHARDHVDDRSLA